MFVHPDTVWTVNRMRHAELVAFADRQRTAAQAVTASPGHLRLVMVRQRVGAALIALGCTLRGPIPEVAMPPPPITPFPGGGLATG